MGLGAAGVVRTASRASRTVIESSAALSRTRSSRAAGAARRTTRPRARRASSTTTAKALGTWPGTAASLSRGARVGSEEKCDGGNFTVLA